MRLSQTRRRSGTATAAIVAAAALTAPGAWWPAASATPASGKAGTITTIAGGVRSPARHQGRDLRPVRDHV